MKLKELLSGAGIMCVTEGVRVKDRKIVTGTLVTFEHMHRHSKLTLWVLQVNMAKNFKKCSVLKKLLNAIIRMTK